MIIGFGGALSAGKDTAGKRFANMVDMPSQQISFAHKLKASVAALFDVDMENFDAWKNDPDALVHLSVGRTHGNISGYEYDEPNVIREFTFREVLQRYGTESHRDVFSQNFWVEQALGGATDPDTLYYVTDVRFDNEVEGVKSRGGQVIQVLTGNEPEIVERLVLGRDQTDLLPALPDRYGYFNFVTGMEVHPSEVPPKGFTHTIMNDVRDDNFEFLDRQLRFIAAELFIPLKWEMTV